MEAKTLQNSQISSVIVSMHNLQKKIRQILERKKQSEWKNSSVTAKYAPR